ncbi:MULTISPECIES: putative phage tail protein [Bacillus]|uniref:putative phage tail protein n=1 Tax=Bacillus TaxID=1386 RepID=UPI0002E4A60F|nr:MULTISPECIES: putative phage tail protein [Bacillus]
MSEYKRDIRTSMRYYVPRYYDDVREVEGMFDAEAKAIKQLNDDIADMLAQYSIETATWGLAYWERLVGMPTDVSKPVDQRRSVVRSKLRGVGTVTVGLIKNVAESYNNGEVEVIEQSADYTIMIKFVSNYGVPPNLADIQNALREIIPAHLALNFEFKFVLYSKIKQDYASYGALKATNKTYSQILNEV